MSEKTEAPKTLWLQVHREVKLEKSDLFMVGVTWSHKQVADTDIKYIRADRYTALLDAAVSLHHHLFELTDALLDRPDITQSEREMADMLDDAQLALDKWNRFLDGKAVEE